LAPRQLLGPHIKWKIPRGVIQILPLMRVTESQAGRRRLEQPRSPRVALAYTPSSQWRNRAEFINGRDEIEAFLERKWSRESIIA